MKKTFAIILVCMFAVTMLTACNGAGATTNQQDTQGNAGNVVQTSQDAPKQDPANNPPSDLQTDPIPISSTPPVSDFDTSRIIAVFTREDGSGTRDAFINITGVGKDMYAEAVVESETNQILSKVEGNEYAIGYVSVGSLNPKVKALNINGITPSNTTIMDGSYTLQRPFLVCVNAENESNELVQDFITFMVSAEGQEIAATKWTKIDTNAPTYASRGLSGTLKVGGSTSVEPFMQALSQAYKAQNPNVNIEISQGGSGVGISESTSGVLNIGMSSRALKDDEKATLTPYNIALDGVAVIVNPANPITDITIEQVREIFVGDVTRWENVGG